MSTFLVKEVVSDGRVVSCESNAQNSEKQLDRYSILHISDLHRDPGNEIDNPTLLQSLLRDLRWQENQGLARPQICIVSGDLVFGASLKSSNYESEMRRQSAQALAFLGDLTDQLFSGERHRVVLIPGNHDISQKHVLASLEQVTLPDQATRESHVRELFHPKSNLRWNWSELSMHRIVHQDLYDDRLSGFSDLYRSFYQGQREYSLHPDKQYDIFDYQDLNLTILALNSCHRNDLMNKSAQVNPCALSTACGELRKPRYRGRQLFATWHHSLEGGAHRTDQLDPAFLQILIAEGVSVGFHGHQHLNACVDMRQRVNGESRKISVVSAGTFCAGPKHLAPGVPRGFNVVEVESTQLKGRVHQRIMANPMFDNPIWSSGVFAETGRSFIEFEICPPLERRPEHLDLTIALESADRLIGNRQLGQAVTLLEPYASDRRARAVISRALEKESNHNAALRIFDPPESSAEIILVAGALLDIFDPIRAQSLLSLAIVNETTDASVSEIVRMLRRRLAK